MPKGEESLPPEARWIAKLPDGETRPAAGHRRFLPPKACGKDDPFSGDILLMRGKYTGKYDGDCYYDTGAPRTTFGGWSATILHESIHSCGCDDEIAGGRSGRRST